MSTLQLDPPWAWTLDAKCRLLITGSRRDRELMFPSPRNGKQISRAKRYCRGCPVAQQCLDDGQGDQHSVRGGLTADERRRLAEGGRILQCAGCRLPFVPRPVNPERCTGCVSRFTGTAPSTEDFKDDILAMYADGASGEQLTLHFGFSRDEIREAGRRWNVHLMRPGRADCGTIAGLAQHHRRKQAPCEPCRNASSRYRYRLRHGGITAAAA